MSMADFERAVLQLRWDTGLFQQAVADRLLAMTLGDVHSGDALRHVLRVAWERLGYRLVDPYDNELLSRSMDAGDPLLIVTDEADEDGGHYRRVWRRYRLEVRFRDMLTADASAGGYQLLAYKVRAALRALAEEAEALDTRFSGALGLSCVRGEQSPHVPVCVMDVTVFCARRPDENTAQERFHRRGFASSGISPQAPGPRLPLTGFAPLAPISNDPLPDSAALPTPPPVMEGLFQMSQMLRRLCDQLGVPVQTEGRILPLAATAHLIEERARALGNVPPEVNALPELVEDVERLRRLPKIIVEEDRPCQ